MDSSFIENAPNPGASTSRCSDLICNAWMMCLRSPCGQCHPYDVPPLSRLKPGGGELMERFFMKSATNPGAPTSRGSGLTRDALEMCLCKPCGHGPPYGGPPSSRLESGGGVLMEGYCMESVTNPGALASRGSGLICDAWETCLSHLGSHGHPYVGPPSSWLASEGGVVMESAFTERFTNPGALTSRGSGLICDALDMCELVMARRCLCSPWARAPSSARPSAVSPDSERIPVGNLSSESALGLLRLAMPPFVQNTDLTTAREREPQLTTAVGCPEFYPSPLAHLAGGFPSHVNADSCTACIDTYLAASRGTCPLPTVGSLRFLPTSGVRFRDLPWHSFAFKLSAGVFPLGDSFGVDSDQDLVPG